MTGVLFKAIGLWLALVAAAIVNGLFRDSVAAPLLGRAIALPLSGVLLTLLIVLVTFAAVPLFGAMSSRGYFGIGAFWVCLTLAFELLFGRYGAGKSWQETAQVFNILQGDLFLLALLMTALAPWLAAKVRGLV